MSRTSAEIEDLASIVLVDRDARRPGEWSGSVEGLSIAQAYAVQQELTALRERRGEAVVGYKIGCTSPTIQRQLGVDRPIFARLFDTGAFRSGDRLLHGAFLNLAVEGELAVRLARDIAARPGSDEECEAAIESCFTVIELHDHALRCDPPCAAELIVRNAMHAGFVAGPNHSYVAGARGIPESMRVQIDETEEDSTSEPWAMGRPGAAIRWLAWSLGEFGSGLRRGHVILTGSVMKLIPVGPDHSVVVEAPPLGTCTAFIRSLS
jgi:2-keto-4-pentenoate hydratase